MSGPRQQVLTLRCPDRRGIVHAVAGAIAAAGGNIDISHQFREPSTESFFMRVEVDVSAADQEALHGSLEAVAADFAMTWRLVARRSVRTVIMVSTEGHCLNDLLYRTQSGTLPVEVVAVVGNHDVLRPLAEFYSVPFHHIPVSPTARAAAESSLREVIRDTDAELLVLARYMQILSPALCHQMAGRVINIHHSFLPSFAGAKPYHQAYERGVKVIGATAHYVTAVLDEGPIIEQDVERVSHAHDVEALKAIGRDLECRALARAVRWHAEHRVLVHENRTVVFA